jgi:hypothetical protein
MIKAGLHTAGYLIVLSYRVMCSIFLKDREMKLVKLLSVAALLNLGLVVGAQAMEIRGGEGHHFGWGHGHHHHNVPAVPEADTWAMMAVGLGLVGLRLRRKNKDATK